MITTKRLSIAAAGALALAFGTGALAQQNAMTFFVTSVGPGKGGDLGGLDGADRHCQKLAEAVGTAGRTWRAYLSTQSEGVRLPSTRAIASAKGRGRM